jgi:hypothetical protein
MTSIRHTDPTSKRRKEFEAAPLEELVVATPDLNPIEKMWRPNEDRFEKKIVLTPFGKADANVRRNPISSSWWWHVFRAGFCQGGYVKLPRKHNIVTQVVR